MMKRHSVFWKLFAGNLLLVGVILLIGGLVSYRWLDANYQQRSWDNQRRITEICRLHFQRSWPRPASEIDAECKQMFGDSPMRLTVINADGRVLGDSQANPHHMENHKTNDRPEVISALRGRFGWARRSSETLGVEFRYFAEPIIIGNKVVGIVRVAMPIRAIAEERAVIHNVLLLASSAAVAVTIVMAALLGWIWYRPLKQIARTARAVAAGDLAAKAHVRGSDELAQLAAALNEMRQSLATQIDTITTQREHLWAIVQNLREGVIALDGGGHIVLMNQAAAKLLGVDAESVIGQHLQSVVRTPDVLDLFNRVVETGEPADGRIELATDHGQLTIDLHTAKVAEAFQKGIATLLVMRDITEITRAVTMKTDFVANASHELRTPLATIRAAVDSLISAEADDLDSIQKVLPILDRHVARLEEMVKDLLDLHIVETAKQKVHADRIKLASLVAWAKEHFAQPARDKSIELKIDTTRPDLVFKSNRTLIHLILQNLVDNAIKFTPPAGSVECRLRPQGNNLFIQVIDTGCGIPPGMQGRVFERFFQIEPSRSGDTKVRGTGLGLAIVKHATERLGGKITLDSAPGRGTTVTVMIPSLSN